MSAIHHHGSRVNLLSFEINTFFITKYLSNHQHIHLFSYLSKDSSIPLFLSGNLLLSLHILEATSGRFCGLLTFPRHSISDTRCSMFVMYFLFLPYSWNQPIFPRILVLFSGQFYLETKIWEPDILIADSRP